MLVILSFIALAWLLLIVAAVALCFAARSADRSASAEVEPIIDGDALLVSLHRSAA